MLLLRLACLLAGFLVLVAPPIVLFPTGASTNELARAAALLLALLVAAASFFFIAATGHRIRSSPRQRRLSTLSLLAPLLAACTALWASTEPSALWMSALLLGFTLTVAIRLSLHAPSPGRLRARETAHPTLLLPFHHGGQSRIICQEPSLN